MHYMNIVPLLNPLFFQGFPKKNIRNGCQFLVYTVGYAKRNTEKRKGFVYIFGETSFIVNNNKDCKQR